MTAPSPSTKDGCSQPASMARSSCLCPAAITSCSSTSPRGRSSSENWANFSAGRDKETPTRGGRLRRRTCRSAKGRQRCLNEHPEHLEHLEHPVHLVHLEHLVPPVYTRASTMVGRHLGQYEIVARLGE